MPKLEIWSLPGQPLKEKDWLAQGFTSLADYINTEVEGHAGHIKKGCIGCMKVQNQPLVSFGTFDLSTGAKEVKMVCEDEKGLPVTDIEGVLEFNK